MAGKKVKVLEGEIRQLKSKISYFQTQISIVHEKIDGKFAIMEEMMKKLLESQTKTTSSEAREAASSQGSEENSNLIRRGKEQEVDI
ncbi:hypothetical protein MA16_Dca001777 [Dendrobium catenatum]|uniref:Uncharacterized protein n=1 Tax=Dendrobium catenatum TaxID=906689 RepID=A0A2I0XDG2_9ASPA|nr:hypothetical protein MA16_Dca001777 [Dendrobium catenatum]